MSSITTARSGYGFVAFVSLIAAALLAIAVSTPVQAEHTEAHVAEKFVNAVNGESVTDPNLGAGSEFIQVQTGDLVQFRIRLINQTQETVDITDVFKFNQFEFVSAEEGACDAPTTSGEDSSIECSVEVVETGANFLLTFRVITEAPEGEGCSTITNTAHISGIEESSDVAQVQVCAPAAPTPSPAPTQALLSDTATDAPTPGTTGALPAALAALGMLILGMAIPVLVLVRRR